MGRSLAALRDLKSHYRHKIEEKHSPSMDDLSRKINEKKYAIAKDMIKKMEDLLLKSFPCEKILKCENGHSEYSVSGKISIGMIIPLDTKEIKDLEKALKAIEKTKAADIKRLEDTWEVDALKAYAEGVGLPDFKI